MNVSRTETVQERRMAMAARLGTARADHSWRDLHDGSCAACGTHSPFRWDRVAHPYVIEEEPF
jgi:hypothetical protein